jgi:peptidoglycan/LPS O-acetylase OafA/YrhL
MTSTVDTAEPSATLSRSAGRLGALDGFRALAATFVVLTHVGFQTGAAINGPYAGLLSRLDVGVTIFFLLSGFLLIGPFLSRHHGGGAPQPLRLYAWHRFLRIMPAYWLAVVGGMLLIESNHGRPLSDWLIQLFAVQTYVTGGLILGLSQMWSLGTEIAFYVALPFIGRWLLLKRSDDPFGRWRRQWLMVAVLVLVAQVWRAGALAAPGGAGLSLYWLPNYLDWFALGMALAVLRARPPGVSRRVALTFVGLAELPGVCWTIAISALWVSTTSLGGPFDLSQSTPAQTFTKHLLYAGFGFFVLLPATVGTGRDRSTRFFGSPFMRWLGTVSYGMFLWNMALLFVAFSLTGITYFTGRFWTILAVEAVLTVAVAAVSWYVVERPALRLRRLVR